MRACAAFFSPSNEKKPYGGREGGASKHAGLCCLAIVVLAGWVPVNMLAQMSPATRPIAEALPDAPGLETPSDVAGKKTEIQKATAGISGTVLDANGDVVQGARVALENRSGGGERFVESGNNGEFDFPGLPAGTFRLSVSGPGMETLTMPDIELRAGEVRMLSQVVIHVVATASEVRVNGDQEELAQQQVTIALDQRMLGFVPNFYSTYDWNAPPMGPKQKFHLAFRAGTDPVAFLGAGILAGIQQANNSYPGYGLGLKGYSKRFAAAYANDISGRFLSSAIFPTLFHQDPRYFYKGSGSYFSRAVYAISRAVITRDDNGRLEPNYSHVLGNFAAGGLSNLYYPAGSRGLSLTLVNALIETVGNAGNNLLREFVLKGLTSHVPTYANGKP